MTAGADGTQVLVPTVVVGRALQLSEADSIDLAGKWKHGWIPLDAVAAAVKAKRGHGGGSARERYIGDQPHRQWMRGKGRAGSATEARREVSRGRPKAAPPRQVKQARGSYPHQHELSVREANALERAGRARYLVHDGEGTASEFAQRHHAVQAATFLGTHKVTKVEPDPAIRDAVRTGPNRKARGSFPHEHELSVRESNHLERSGKPVFRVYDGEGTASEFATRAAAQQAATYLGTHKVTRIEPDPAIRYDAPTRRGRKQ